MTIKALKLNRLPDGRSVRILKIGNKRGFTQTELFDLVKAAREGNGLFSPKTESLMENADFEAAISNGSFQICFRRKNIISSTRMRGYCVYMGKHDRSDNLITRLDRLGDHIVYKEIGDQYTMIIPSVTLPHFGGINLRDVRLMAIFDIMDLVYDHGKKVVTVIDDFDPKNIHLVDVAPIWAKVDAKGFPLRTKRISCELPEARIFETTTDIEKGSICGFHGSIGRCALNYVNLRYIEAVSWRSNELAVSVVSK